MSRHESRQKLAREFGETDIVAKRGDDGVNRIMDMTNGIGTDSVLECVGAQQSMTQAIQSTRRGGYISHVGVPHDVEFKGEECFTPTSTYTAVLPRFEGIFPSSSSW
jgi:threonine dehydrogenase-like Zn-dependent dehydrogenase